MAGFLTEVPPTLADRLAATNETSGVFVQTKTLPDGRVFRSGGTFRIRPGRDFEWSVHEPFETMFYATPGKYVYTNEDERVERELASMPRFSGLEGAIAGDFSAFFRMFDALYKEEDGKFFLKAKPKIRELKPLLEKVEAEGVPSDWSLTATFPGGTVFRIDIKETGQ